MNTQSQNQAVVASTEVKLHRNTKDLRGQKFGCLTVFEFTNIRTAFPTSQRKWKCVCDCGEIVLANQTQLKEERITICQECVDAALSFHLEREKDAINKVKTEGVKALPTKQFLDECFLYDPDIGTLTWKRRPMSHFASEMVWNMWLAHYEGKIAGKPADRRDGKPHAVFVKLSIGENNLVYLAHRIIGAIMEIDIPPGMQIDHEDRNPWNNKLSNLRVATAPQNIANQGKRKSRKGLLKGVSSLLNGTFQGLISVDGKQMSLGAFKTEQEAHEAYCAKAKEVHGEFFCAG